MLILVTGANGQLGWDCVAEGRSRGYGVAGFVRAELDITDRDAVMKKVQEIKPDTIIHCAAWTKKLIYVSTDYVFDGSGTEPWTPEDYSHPLNTYGQSKLDGENIVRGTTDKHFIVRTSWLYGSHGKNFVKTMLRVGRERDTVRVVNDQIGTPTYTSDLARLLLDMAGTEKYGIYHAVNTGGYISWYEFAKEIFAKSGMNCKVIPVNSEEYRTKAIRPKNSRMETGKLIEAGFVQLPNWKDALKRYMSYGTD